MSVKYLIPGDGNFYKANLHCHSTFSDGRYTVEHLKNVFRERGYSIIAYSDHNRLVPHAELKDDNFLPLTATEIDINGDGGRTYHLNFFSSVEMRNTYPPVERIYSTDAINKIIADFNNAGFLCQYNHPRWSMQDARDFVGLEGLWGFEVFNTGCEKEMINGWGDYEYEVYLREANRKTAGYPAATATDDNHEFFMDDNSPHNDAFGGWVMIKARELSYPVIFEALAHKDFYASTGPEIKELYVADGKIHMESSPVCCAMLRTETRYTDIRRTHKDEMTVNDFNIPSDFTYIRFELTDIYGHMALSRAYTPEEIL